jgi:hypothetical protein
VLLPLVLFFLSVGERILVYRVWLQTNIPYLATHLAALWMLGQQRHVHRLAVRSSPILIIAFPLCLAQNLLTTALIVFKIWHQQIQGKAVGLVSVFGPRLTSAVRIVIESVALYTILILVLVVLRALDHPGRFIVHCMIPPSTGKWPQVHFPQVLLNLAL